MRRRTVALVALAALLVPAAVAAQQRLTNFSVVEVEKINQFFYQESKRAKEFRAFLDLVKQEQKVYDAAIEELKGRRLEASRANNRDEVSRLDRQIADKENERATYLRIQDQKRKDMLADLLSNDAYYRELIAAIEWVCHQEGYAGALRIPDTPLLWWDPEIDITDKVIERMRSE